METVNELIYTPKGERDYGTLACFGTNSIGKQMEPCLFQVVPAGTYEIMQHFRGGGGGRETVIVKSSRHKPWGETSARSFR
jgi:hypothetical protein